MAQSAVTRYGAARLRIDYEQDDIRGLADARLIQNSPPRSGMATRAQAPHCNDFDADGSCDRMAAYLERLALASRPRAAHFGCSLDAQEAFVK